MKRYQVYLNQNSVNVLDDFGEKTNLDRSVMIRMAIKTLAENLSKLKMKQGDIPGDLDKAIGLIKANKSDSSKRVDDIYFGK